MNRYFTLLFIYLLASYTLKGQIVNIESLRFLSDSNGFYGQLTAETEYKKNKIMQIKVEGGAHLAYKQGRHSILNSTTFEYSKIEKAENEKNFFFHIRYNYGFSERWIGELFFQAKYDEFLNIDQRELSGIGIRTGIIDKDRLKLFAGATAMYEYEVLTNEDENHRLRMSDYTSLRMIADEFTFTTTLYYQPVFNDFSRFRASWSSQLEFKLINNFGIFINYDLGYDHNRTKGIPKMVTELTGGATYLFR